jgi:hypothetical protein
MAKGEWVEIFDGEEGAFVGDWSREARGFVRMDAGFCGYGGESVH